MKDLPLKENMCFALVTEHNVLGLNILPQNRSFMSIIISYIARLEYNKFKEPKSEIIYTN